MWSPGSAAYQSLSAAHAERLALSESDFSPELLHERQRYKLDLLWQRASEVPYFQGKPELRDRSLADVPVTDRATFKENPHLFLWPGAGAYHKYYETSGSAGAPTPTPRLPADLAWNAVAVSTLWSRTLSAGDRVAALLPSDVAPVTDLVASVAEYLDCTMLRCYPFTQGICDWDRVESLFTSYGPQHVFAAPGVLLQWTRLLKQRGRLDKISGGVDSLLLLGEVSTAPLRRRLAEEWDARVLDVSYGSTETGTIAAACEHDRLHLLLQSHLAEIREDGVTRPAEPGRSGELVVTTLNNFARPLLRYGTGDLVTVGDADDCPCGLRLPVLTVHGRAAESVVVGGAPLTAADIEEVLYTVPGVTGYVIQLKEPDGAAARLVLERDVDFTADAEELHATVRDRFAALGVTWTQVVSVAQLPQLSKAGGSQKNWKRTNVQWVR